MRRGGQAARLPMSRAVPDIIQNPCSVFVCTCLYFGAFGALQAGTPALPAARDCPPGRARHRVICPPGRIRVHSGGEWS
jgi:hypothetical protein